MSETGRRFQPRGTTSTDVRQMLSRARRAGARDRPPERERPPERREASGERKVSIQTPPDYRALDETGLAAYLADLPELAARLGGEPADWRVREVGDGNLNLVFIVEGPVGDLCVKQALPYVRLVGESWPLPLERAFFEYEASVLQARHAQPWMPEIHHYDPKLYLIVMERLSPHIIMRYGTIEGRIYPHFADHIAEYLARTLYFTSDFALPAGEKKKLVARFCDNIELCKITEDLIFTDPYRISERNRWTSPQLDADAAAIRADGALKAAVSELKHRFMSDTQALLHGDLHTGSIMVTEEETKVIDPEFAFFGPMGFDVGKLIGNLLLCYFSQAGHEAHPGERDAYRAWLLDTAEAVWSGFESRFLELWEAHRTGDAYPPDLFEGGEGERVFHAAQKRFLRGVFADSLGYAGTSMIRRTLGLAHNADMERIEDPDLRAACERLNLRLARELIVHRRNFEEIADVTARARQIFEQWRGRTAA